MPRSRDPHPHRRSHLVVRRPRTFPTVTTSWIWQTHRDLPRLAMARIPSAPRSTQRLSSARFVLSDSLEPTIFVRICVLIRTSVRLYAVFVVKRLPANMIASDTRVSTPGRRSLSAVACSKTTVVGVVGDGSPVLMPSAVISDRRPVVYASDLYLRKRHRRRVAGSRTSRWTTATACMAAQSRLRIMAV
jgi:hypothetical protein